MGGVVWMLRSEQLYCAGIILESQWGFYSRQDKNKTPYKQLLIRQNARHFGTCVKHKASLTECKSGTTEFESIPRLSSKIYRKLQTKKKKNKQNAIKVNTVKVIPKYYSGVLVVGTFSFAHCSNTAVFYVCHYCIQLHYACYASLLGSKYTYFPLQGLPAAVAQDTRASISWVQTLSDLSNSDVSEGSAQFWAEHTHTHTHKRKSSLNTNSSTLEHVRPQNYQMEALVIAQQ